MKLKLEKPKGWEDGRGERWKDRRMEGWKDGGINWQKTSFNHGNFDQKLQYIAILFLPKAVNYNITTKILKYLQVMNTLNIYRLNQETILQVKCCAKNP